MRVTFHGTYYDLRDLCRWGHENAVPMTVTRGAFSENKNHYYNSRQYALMFLPNHRDSSLIARVKTSLLIRESDYAILQIRFPGMFKLR